MTTERHFHQPGDRCTYFRTLRKAKTASRPRMKRRRRSGGSWPGFDCMHVACGCQTIAENNRFDFCLGRKRVGGRAESEKLREVYAAAHMDGVLFAASVGPGRGAARGECGDRVESFCQRGRSA